MIGMFSAQENRVRLSGLETRIALLEAKDAHVRTFEEQEELDEARAAAIEIAVWLADLKRIEG